LEVCGIIVKTADITKVVILVVLTNGRVCLKMYLEYSKRQYKYNYIGGRISRYICAFEAKMGAKLAHIPSDEERVYKGKKTVT